jgi:hypothetical protein
MSNTLASEHNIFMLWFHMAPIGSRDFTSIHIGAQMKYNPLSRVQLKVVELKCETVKAQIEGNLKWTIALLYSRP